MHRWRRTRKARKGGSRTPADLEFSQIPHVNRENQRHYSFGGNCLERFINEKISYSIVQGGSVLREGTVICLAEGWKVPSIDTLDLLEEGEFTVSITLGESTVKAKLIKDVQVPVMSLNDHGEVPPLGSFINGEEVEFGGLCIREAGEVSYELFGEDGLPLASGNTSCTVEDGHRARVNLSGVMDQEIRLVVNFQDEAKNKAPEVEWSFTKDTQAPTVSVNGGFVNGSNQATYSLSGDCSEQGREVTVEVVGLTPPPHGPAPV